MRKYVRKLNEMSWFIHPQSKGCGLFWTLDQRTINSFLKGKKTNRVFISNAFPSHTIANITIKIIRERSGHHYFLCTKDFQTLSIYFAGLCYEDFNRAVSIGTEVSTVKEYKEAKKNFNLICPDIPRFLIINATENIKLNDCTFVDMIIFSGTKKQVHRAIDDIAGRVNLTIKKMDDEFLPVVRGKVWINFDGRSQPKGRD